MQNKYLKHVYFYQQSQADQFGGDFCPAYYYELRNNEIPEMVICNWHEDVEFIYVNKGVFHLYINEVLYELHEGDLAIVNSNYLHYGNAPEDSFCEIFVILFRLQDLISDRSPNEPHLAALANNLLWFPPVIHPAEPIYAPLCELLRLIHGMLIERPVGADLKIKSLLFDILFLFCTHEEYFIREPGWDSSNAKEKLLALHSFLNEHYSEHFTVRELAENLHMSQDSFYKFTSSAIGCSPVTYVNRYRLSRAAEMLDTTNLSVTDVCFQCGFQNISYFIRAFKKQYGLTPKQHANRRKQ